MKFRITLTWSKIIALMVLIFAYLIDYRQGTNTTFMFSLPFIVALITGKQLIQKNKPNAEK